MQYPAYGTEKPYQGLEWQLQQATAMALDSWPGLYWFHVANERKSSTQRGRNLKKQGVKAGVLDNIIINPSKVYYGLVIELKVMNTRS
jgi:hypothetical protein